VRSIHWFMGQASGLSHLTQILKFSFLGRNGSLTRIVLLPTLPYPSNGLREEVEEVGGANVGQFSL